MRLSGFIHKMAVLKVYLNILFLFTCFDDRVLCNLVAKGTDVCSGENSVQVGDVCFLMIKNATSPFHAKESCNSTGGLLWETSDLDDVFEQIKINPNFTGYFWVDNANDVDITIDRRTLWSRCLPTIRLGSYNEDHGLKMTINYYTTSFCTVTRVFLICKYDISLELKPTSVILPPVTNGHANVPLCVPIILGVLLVLVIVGFIITLACICRRRHQHRQYKALYLAATSPEIQERYDAPTSNAHRTLVYDIPLEENDTKEQETLLEGETKPKEQHSFFYSIMNAAQAAVTRKHRHHDKDCKSKEAQEMKEMRVYDQKKTPKKDGNPDNEKRNASLTVELPRNPTLNELKIIEKGKVGKVASMFEPSKIEETGADKAKPAPKPKPRDMQQRESKTDLKDPLSDKSITVLPKSTSKSSFNTSVNQNTNEKQNRIDESKSDKKKEVKEKKDSEKTGNDKDIKKGSILDKLKGHQKDKEKDEVKTKVKDNKNGNKKSNTADVEKRKEEERLKQLEMDKEIERQRDIAIKAHEASHEYMYVEEDDKMDGQTEEDLYEPVLVYENEESC